MQKKKKRGKINELENFSSKTGNVTHLLCFSDRGRKVVGHSSTVPLSSHLNDILHPKTKGEGVRENKTSTLSYCRSY